MNANIDSRLLEEFIVESRDGLEQVEALLVALERSPGDLGLVNRIFRPVHSLKGNAAYFGYMEVKRLAHSMENLLDALRQEALKADGTMTALLLTGTDLLGKMLQPGGGDVEAASGGEALDDLLTALEAARSGQTDGRLQEAITLVARLQGLLPPDVQEAHQVIGQLRAVLCEPADAATAGPDWTGTPADSALKLLKAWQITAPSDDSLPVLEVYLKSWRQAAHSEVSAQVLDGMLDTYATFTTAMGFDPLLVELLLEKAAPLVPGDFTFARPDAPPPRSGAAAVNTAEPDSDRTMRIRESEIDHFLEYVGELLVVGDMFQFIQVELAKHANLGELPNNFRRANITFSGLSEQLRTSILALRKVPVGSLFHKVHRIVHDIAAGAGKEITVAISGEKLAIDKSLADILDSSLVHLVRNSADHGIESREDRQRAGKPAGGVLRIAATETETLLLITVADDGRGLNLGALRAKAVALGIVPADRELSHHETTDLLFHAGVSTARKVTDVSGRGVGMDVVRQMVRDAGGSIAVESEPGKGTTFTLSLPKKVTTQIMNGFLVSVGNECFILPMDKVRETISVAPGNLTQTPGGKRCLLHQGRVLRVEFLAELLRVATGGATGRAAEMLLFVILADGNASVALGIDQVLGVRQVVLRSLPGLATNYRALSGAAIRGDGSVALVLDPQELLKSQ